MWNMPWQFCFQWCVGVSITATKFAPEVVKFCCDCVRVENSVSEVKGCQSERLLQNERRDAKFNHCDVWGGEAV